MKVLKVLASVWFVVLLIGVPAAVLTTTPTAPVDPGVSMPQKPPNGQSAENSIDRAAYCSEYHRYGTSRGCYYPYPLPTPEPIDNNGYAKGVERFLLLGATNPDNPGNSTTSFLMAFFGVSALIAGATAAIQRRRWLLPTTLLAGGGALFLAGQILWSDADNEGWLVAFAFLAVNLAVIAGLGFIIFKSVEARRHLTIFITGAVVVATVMVQSGIFYHLIGTPDRYSYLDRSAPYVGSAPDNSLSSIEPAVDGTVGGTYDELCPEINGKRGC